MLILSDPTDLMRFRGLFRSKFNPCAKAHHSSYSLTSPKFSSFPVLLIAAGPLSANSGVGMALPASPSLLSTSSVPSIRLGVHRNCFRAREVVTCANRISHRDIGKRISEKMGMPEEHGIQLTKIVLTELKEAVLAGEEVSLVGFGTLSSKTQKSRKSRNPRTGEQVQVPEKVVPTFSLSKTFKEVVAQVGVPAR